MIVGCIKIAKGERRLQAKIPQIVRLVHREQTKSPIVIDWLNAECKNKRILKLKLKEHDARINEQDEGNASESCHTLTESM